MNITEYFNYSLPQVAELAKANPTELVKVLSQLRDFLSMNPKTDIGDVIRLFQMAVDLASPKGREPSFKSNEYYELKKLINS